MMLAAPFLLLAQAAAPPAEPDAIVVMAERLGSIEARVGQDHEGRWHCSLSAGSGNADLDDGLCRAATQCSREHGNDREKIEWCMEKGRAGLLQDFRSELRRSRG